MAGGRVAELIGAAFIVDHLSNCFKYNIQSGGWPLKSLMDMGVSSSHIQQAIEVFKTGHGDVTLSPSKSTYLRCPVDLELWDLKPVVCTASALAGEPIGSSEFNSRRFQPELVRFGFPVVRFDDLRLRQLGMRGCDLSELAEQHTVFWPPAMLEQRNGFAVELRTVDAGNPRKKSVLVSKFVRNSELRRKVRDSAKGVCQSCGERAFKTSGGDWFLEVHHKKWLREGGPDVEDNLIALCPNCHRQEHFGKNRKFF